MSQQGFVYIMEAEPGLCKIGVTKNYPEIRKYQISNENKRPLKIRGYYICDQIYKVEKIIHHFLDEFRIKGEWFELSYESIVEALSPTYEFKEYHAEEVPKIGKIHKLTVYLNEQDIRKLNEICSKKVLENGKPDKSALISRAVDLLYEHMKDG